MGSISLFWKNCHFVILAGITKKGYCLNDPATGPRVVSAEQFTKDYSGIAQSFVPKERFEPSGRRTSVLAFAKKRLAGIDDVMEYEEDPAFDHATGEAAFGEIKGHVSIQNVTFGYSVQAPPLLNNFSLELTPGRKVALVGSSGCGKSTISKLVAGLYQPWSGEILYDGKPMGAYDRAAFTSAIAVVDQDIFLFPESIKFFLGIIGSQHSFVYFICLLL